MANYRIDTWMLVVTVSVFFQYSMLELLAIIGLGSKWWFLLADRVVRNVELVYGHGLCEDDCVYLMLTSFGSQLSTFFSTPIDYGVVCVALDGLIIG